MQTNDLKTTHLILYEIMGMLNFLLYKLGLIKKTKQFIVLLLDTFFLSH